MAKLYIPFGSTNIDGPWNASPQPKSNIDLLEEVSDVIPGPQGTAMPRRSISAITTPALTGKCLGVMSTQDVSLLNDIVIAGDASKLYRAYSTSTGTFTFSDISKPGGYATATGETWEFATFNVRDDVGTPAGIRIIATNFTDHIQCITVRSSTTATFSDLIPSGSKPKARHLAVIGQFLVLGNMNIATSTTAAYVPSRVWWSAFGSATSFTPAGSTQADYEDFATGGAVQKIVGGTEYGLVFQQEQVQVMRYVGGTTIFDFAPINYAPGTPIPGSVIAHAGSVFYIASDGFKALHGLELKHIGNNIIDRYFWGAVYQPRLYQVSAAVDTTNKLIIWSFPNGDDDFNRVCLIYKYDDGRWVRWFPSSGVELIASIRKGYSSEKFIAFDTAHKLATFTGVVCTAQFETKALQPSPGRRWQCNGIRLISDNAGTGATQTGTAKARVADSPLPATTPTSTNTVSLRPDLYFPMRTAGRYQRFSLLLDAAAADALTTHWTGMEIDYEVLGER